MIKTNKYFIKLINLSLFVWSIGNVKFENTDKEYNNEFIFVHGLDRIKFYLKRIDAFSK